MNDMEYIGALLRTIFLFTIIGGVIGILFKYPDNITIGAAWGSIAGIVVGTWLALDKVARLLFPDSFYNYSYDAPEVESTATSRYLDVQCWTDKTTSNWIRLGVTDEQWYKAAASVHNSKKYSTDTVDRQVYAKITARLEEIGLIVSEGKGKALTRSGEKFFEHLATLPYPYESEPELVKLLDE